MFSMIITVISIALVAVLAIATIYYGASYMSDGTTKAQVARVLQEGNQIVGAFELYRVDNETMKPGTSDDMVKELTDGSYLAKWPGAEWSLQSDFAVRGDLTDKMCLEVNKKFGIEGIPSCDSAGITDKTFCCSTDAAVTP